MAKGHGGYDELPSEKDFFDKIKNCKRAVVHFYRPTTLRCEIFGKKAAFYIRRCLFETLQISTWRFWRQSTLKRDLSS